MPREERLPKVGGGSPWGTIDDVRLVADGIYNVCTPGHGGYYLDNARLAEFRKLFPKFKPFAGFPWFEEDCDWAMVTIAFPQYFHDAQVFNAVRTAGGLEPWLETPAGADVKRRHDAYAATVDGKWKVGGMGTVHHLKLDLPAHTWSVMLSRDGQRKSVYMPYPQQQFYSDAELAELECKPTPATV
jgi:hypothetical protein